MDINHPDYTDMDVDDASDVPAELDPLTPAI
jgi:hypothetical protein